MGEQFCLKWNNHQSTLISVFDTLLETEKHVDCSLASEGKFLKAHKVVLSACSPYLEQLLNHERDKYPVLVFSDVKYDYLKAMLDYMYRGEVNVLQEHLNGFLKAAETLQIKGLTDQGGGEPKRKQPARMTEIPQPPSPSQERSMSPTVPAKRRRQRRSSQDQLSDSHVDTSNSCDIPPIPPPAPVTKPQGETDRLSNSSTSVQPKLEPVENPVVQPKTEFIDDANDEQIEDLTLDDDDDDSYMAKPSSSHGNDSQGYGGNEWQLGPGRTNDQVFLGEQSPVISQNDTQGRNQNEPEEKNPVSTLDKFGNVKVLKLERIKEGEEERLAFLGNDDYSPQTKELNELNQLLAETTKAMKLELESEESECGFESYSSPCSFRSDDNWSSNLSILCSLRRRRRRLKEWKPEERKLRKKEQNRGAASRYRMKKKMQVEGILGEERELRKINTELRNRLNDLVEESKHLKSLMRDTSKTKPE